ncbi:MAG: hypothetical protein HWE08_11610 [Alphaproteobacteria bacterium]|nr:hypothetical protein [Alphaproteobacteria bacterium]
MAQLKPGILGALLILGVGACGPASMAIDDGVPEPAPDMTLPSGEMIGDVVMPAGSAMDAKRSIILGNGNNAYGKIIAEVRAKQVKVMQFYKENMPTQGWGLISEIQDDDIILTFQKPTRVAVIQIERGRSTDLTITVTPRN